ncbi:MAG: histidine kinase dimerization/phospho-acceptor domain-containing protein, partial [Pseudomonadota bacterium]
MSESTTTDLWWQTLPNPALVVGPEGRIVSINGTAETFLGVSERQIAGRKISRYLGEDSRLQELVDRVLRQGVTAGEYDYEFAWPGLPARIIDVQAAPVGEIADQAIVLLHPRAMAASMDRSLIHRSAARSVSGMAAMLAHEIKNPLAGISGAAQLLEMQVDDTERDLAMLIREETDRIGKLLASFE